MAAKIKVSGSSFGSVWRMRAGRDAPQPIEEHPFHPKRQWRFDFAFPGAMLAVEIEGGIWKRGRHNRPSGYQNDCIKYNAATMLGWRILRYTTDDLAKRPAQVIDEIKQALAAGDG